MKEKRGDGGKERRNGGWGEEDGEPRLALTCEGENWRRPGRRKAASAVTLAAAEKVRTSPRAQCTDHLGRLGRAIERAWGTRGSEREDGKIVDKGDKEDKAAKEDTTRLHRQAPGTTPSVQVERRATIVVEQVPGSLVEEALGDRQILSVALEETTSFDPNKTTHSIDLNTSTMR